MSAPDETPPGGARTLDLKEAAALLHMNPERLRQRAKAGIVPGAKPGRRWLFLEADLVAYLRSLYARPWQAPQGQTEATWPYIYAEQSTGSATQTRTDAEYKAALTRRTVKQHRSFTTNSRPTPGASRD